MRKILFLILATLGAVTVVAGDTILQDGCCRNANMSSSMNVISQDDGDDDTFEIPICQSPLGDVNGDGHINMTDVIVMINYILGHDTPSFIRELADLNGDDKVNMSDIVCIIGIILGK